MISESIFLIQANKNISSFKNVCARMYENNSND